MSNNSLPEAPEKLIGYDGLATFGSYGGAIGEINAEEFDFTRLERPPWTWLRSAAGKLFKRWQFVGAIDENIIFGAAVAHVQYLGTGFTYLYDRKTRELTECNIKKPFAIGTSFSRSPNSGVTQIKKGSRLILADNLLQNSSRRLEVDFGKAIRGRIIYQEPGTGVSTLCPQAVNGFHYTYKSAGLPASGSVWVGEKEYILTENAMALLDWTASTPPRATTWNWSAGVGHDDQGRSCGINFSRGLVGGSYSQNTVWLDGRPHMLGPVTFDYNSEDILGVPWRLSTEDGALDLHFTPARERYENINLGLVASSLHQPFGAFEGEFKHDGKCVGLKAFGFCEQHYAKW